MLLLPDRRTRFEFVDDVFARVKRLRAVRARSGNSYGNLAYLQITDPMNDGDLGYPKTLARFRCDFFEFRDRHRLVSFI
jgi:hypothetical protein